MTWADKVGAQIELARLQPHATATVRIGFTRIGLDHPKLAYRKSAKAQSSGFCACCLPMEIKASGRPRLALRSRMNHPQPVTDIGIVEIQFGAVANVDVLVRCGASSRKTLAHLDSPRAAPDWVHEYVDSLFHIILQLDIGVRMLFTRPVDLLSGA